MSAAGRWRRFRGELPYRFYAGRVARDMNYSLDMTDRAIDGLADRVAALEEIVAASWPRSMVLRRRLAREMRKSVAGYEYVRPDFRVRRGEWAGEQVVLSAMRFRALHEGKRDR